MARQRNAAGLAKQRDWTRRHRELLARERALLPPMPDPERQPREFAAWMQENAREPSPALRRLLDELHDLPGVKYRRARDDEVWSWVLWLLSCQRWGAPYDLRTCKLGANPANQNARPSKMLRYLTATVANKYQNVNATRLYDAIRNWRKHRAELELD
jgi:hypothetical protein